MSKRSPVTWKHVTVRIGLLLGYLPNHPCNNYTILDSEIRPTCLESPAEVLHGATIRCLPDQSETIGTFCRHHPADSPPPMGHMREQRDLHLLCCQWQRLSSTSRGASRCAAPIPARVGLPRVHLSQRKAMLVFTGVLLSTRLAWMD